MNGDDWIKILPVYGGVAVAFWGVWKWRLELHGREDFEAAKRCLYAVYDLRNTISDVRIEFTPPDYLQKRKVLLDAMRKFEVQLQEAEVLWGRELLDASEKLKQCVRTLLINLHKQYRAEQHPSYRGRLEKSGEDEEVDAIVWGDPKDEFAEEVVAAVRECEDVLRRRMKRSAKTFRLRVIELREEARPHVKRILDALLAK